MQITAGNKPKGSASAGASSCWRPGDFLRGRAFFDFNVMGDFLSFGESVHHARFDGSGAWGPRTLAGKDWARGKRREMATPTATDEGKSGSWQRDHSHTAQSQNVALGRLLHHEETTRRCTGNSACKLHWLLTRAPIRYCKSLMWLRQ